MFKQGLQQVKICIQNFQNKTKQYSFPQMINKNNSAVQKVKEQFDMFHNIIPTHIIEQQSSFCTRTFFIRYMDETVEMNEMCKFRTEMPLHLLETNPQFHLEFELMQHEIKYEDMHLITDSKDDYEPEFRSMYNMKFLLNNPHLGFIEQKEVYFYGSYFSQLNILASAFTIQFKVKPMKNQLSVKESATEEPHVAEIRNVVANIFYTNIDNIESHFKKFLMFRISKMYIIIFHCFKKLKYQSKDVQQKCLTSKLLKLLSENNDDQENFNKIINEQENSEQNDINLYINRIIENLQHKIKCLSNEIIANKIEKTEFISSEMNVKFCNELLSCIMNEFREIQIKNQEMYQRFSEISIVVSFFVVEMFKDDFNNKNKYIVKKFLISNNIQCDSIIDMHPVENIKSSRKSSVKQFRDYQKDKENQLIENEKQFINVIDNSQWATEQIQDQRHNLIFSMWGESDFPDSANIPIIFEDVWIPKNYSKNAIVSTERDEELIESLVTTKVTTETNAKPNGLSPMINYTQKDSLQIDELFRFDLKKKILRTFKKRKGLHLIVLVHGFQGSSFDLRQQKDQISQLQPNTVFFTSCQNEDKMERPIDEMGLVLANEVKDYIKSYFRQSFEVVLDKMSFITFSLGALITRAALPHLRDQHRYFNSFISLSGIHLGLYSSQSQLLNFGLWFIDRQKQFTPINQMLLKDFDPKAGQTIRDTCIYQLSLQDQLKHFRHFLLAYSDEDGYNLPECAHLMPSPECVKTKQWTDITGEMLGNVAKSLEGKKVHRMTVDFVIKNKRVDKMIGRAAHIQFIENPYFVKMLAYNQSSFFQ